MIDKIKNFFSGSYDELKKVVWPSRPVIINHTLIVIVSIVVAVAITAVIDAGLLSLFQLLLERK